MLHAPTEVIDVDHEYGQHIQRRVNLSFEMRRIFTSQLPYQNAQKILPMTKIDYKKELFPFYRSSSKKVIEVMVPAMAYLMIDGCGDPNTSPAYAEAVEALFSVSYTAKFALKRATPPCDFAVMPLEGVWWADDHSVFVTNDRKNWKWTMMIMQPPVVNAEAIETAIAAVRSKKNLSALGGLRFESFTERDAVRKLCTLVPLPKRGQRFSEFMISSMLVVV